MSRKKNGNKRSKKQPGDTTSKHQHPNGNDNQKQPNNNKNGKQEEHDNAHDNILLDPKKMVKFPLVVTNLDDDDSATTSEGGDHSFFGDDDYNSGMYRGLRGRRYCLSSLRFFGLTIFLWCSQYVVSSSMKHLGVLVLEGDEMRFDFDPSLMAQRVIPQQLQENWNSMFNDSLSATYYTRQSQRPGYQLYQEGARVHFPVVIIPGFVTSGLEVWTARECAKKYFRQRIWTGIDSARALFTDKNCWREHVALDPFTGKDPEGIRLRAAQGFSAADYFMANYWVWEKLLENLADLGYSPSNMIIEPYDWRMAFPLLEERDGYMTKLKYQIEAMHKSSGKKVVMTSHSMGAQLCHFFFKWVTTKKQEGGGGGGKNWVDEHVHAYINIAGSHLGVPKAASALLSGEMKDTVLMGPVGTMMEQFFGRKLRKDLFNTWGSLWAMLPKGGDRIWDIGADVCLNVSDPEDPFCKSPVNESGNAASEGGVPLLFLKGAEESSLDKKDCGVDADNKDVCDHETIFDIPHDDGTLNATVAGFANNNQHSTGSLIKFLREWGAGLGSELHSSKLYTNYGDTKSKQRNKPKVEWLDTTITPLPHARNLKIYCLYGVGLETERNYFYKVNNQVRQTAADNASIHPQTPRPDVELPFVLDVEVDDPERNIKHGMRFTDGDGSVPLLSLGYICSDAWTRKDSGLNPSGTKVVTREYAHQAEFTTDDPFRGGPRSADHVDILGNIGMTEDFLRVVADFEPNTEDKIESNIREVVKILNEHPKGGLFKKRGIFK